MKRISDIILKSIANREKRIDEIFEKIRVNADSPERVGRLCDQWEEELKTGQKHRNIIFFIFAIFLIVLIALFIYSSHQKSLRTDLEHKAKLALGYFETQNLPVTFRNAHVGDLQVRFIEPESEVPDAVKSEVDALLKNRYGFGRHPGLGADRELKATIMSRFQGGLKYMIHPTNEQSVLGLLTLNTNNGRLSVQDEPIVPGGEPRQFEDLPNFALKIENFNESTNQWTIRFCERAAGEDFMCSQDAYTVKKSHKGHRQEHFLVKNPDWEGSYMVSIGFGEQGEEGRVWTVNARVTQFRLAN